MKNRIRTEREARQWTQQFLADKIGTAQPQIDRWEKNQRRVSDFWVQKIADAMGIPAIELWESERIKAEEQIELRDTEIALIYVIKELLDIVTRKKEGTPHIITSDFKYALDSYHGRLPGAASVMNELLAHVKGASRRGRQSTIHKLLSLSPPQ